MFSLVASCTFVGATIEISGLERKTNLSYIETKLKKAEEYLVGIVSHISELPPNRAPLAKAGKCWIAHAGVFSLKNIAMLCDYPCMGYFSS